MAERLPLGVYNADSMRGIYPSNGFEPNGIHNPDGNGEYHSNFFNSSDLASSMGADHAPVNGMLSPGELSKDSLGGNEINTHDQKEGVLNPSRDGHPEFRLPNGSVGGDVSEVAPESTRSRLIQNDNASTRSNDSTLIRNIGHVEAEWIEQYESGVYITLVALRDGTRDLKCVSFKYLIYFPTHLIFFCTHLIFFCN